MSDEQISFANSMLERFHAQFPEIPIFAAAQRLGDGDYLSFVNYIYKGSEGLGITGALRTCWNWFYDSDYDYMVYSDQHDKIPDGRVNAARSVWLTLNDTSPDVIMTSIGAQVFGLRAEDGRRSDFTENIKLYPSRRDLVEPTVVGFHFSCFCNFRKRYAERPMVSEDFVVSREKGIPHDPPTLGMLNHFYNLYYAPEISVDDLADKHLQSRSSWADKPFWPGVKIGRTHYIDGVPHTLYTQRIGWEMGEAMGLKCHRRPENNIITLERVKDQSYDNRCGPTKPRKIKEKQEADSLF